MIRFFCEVCDKYVETSKLETIEDPKVGDYGCDVLCGECLVIITSIETDSPVQIGKLST